MCLTVQTLCVEGGPGRDPSGAEYPLGDRWGEMPLRCLQVSFNALKQAEALPVALRFGYKGVMCAPQGLEAEKKTLPFCRCESAAEQATWQSRKVVQASGVKPPQGAFLCHVPSLTA